MQCWGLNLTVVLRVVFLASCDAGDSAIALISVFALDREKREREIGGVGPGERKEHRISVTS